MFRFGPDGHRDRTGDAETLFAGRIADFPGHTFRVLKEKEEKQFGEYRTRRLILQAWERLGDLSDASQS